MSVVHVDFRKPKAPSVGQPLDAAAPEASPAFPIPDFLTAECAEEWLRANFRKDALDTTALMSVCVRGDINAVVALMLLSDDESMAAAGSHLRVLLERYAATDPARRPSARHLTAATLANREKGIPLPEGWQTDKGVCADYVAQARKAPAKAPAKAPLAPVRTDWREPQPWGARFDVLREVGAELGLDPATVAAVDQRLAAKLDLAAARPVPACVRGSRSKIAKRFGPMLGEHFDFERTVLNGREDFEVSVAIPKAHCAWRHPIALIDAGSLSYGRKAITTALEHGIDLAHSAILDDTESDRLGFDVVNWVGVFSAKDRLESDYDGLDLAARFGVGIFVIDEIRSGWDLRFQVGDKTLWSSMSGTRLARAL